MKRVHYSRFFSFLVSATLLISSLPLSAIAQDIQPVSHNQDDVYVYLGKELSDIDQVLLRIKHLDDNQNSPLDELHSHIKNGLFLAPYNNVLEVLEYADTILQSNSDKLNHDQSKQLHNDFEFLVNKFLDGELNINPQLLEQSEHLLVSDNDMALRAAHLRTLRVDENMDVLGKTTLYKHLNCKQGAHIQGKLKVDKSAKFKKNVTINGTLSVTDLVVASCIDSLCVNNLSVTNEVIGNLTVTNLSVVNESVSGTLSVNNAIVNGNLSVASEVVNCDLTVGCNISMNDSTSAAVGNIIKNGTPFIHNFGTNNTFVGDNAGNFTTSGSGGNNAFGVNALMNNTTGTQNTAVGASALADNTIGIRNTAIGFNALTDNTIGTSSTAVGFSALTANTTGTQNTAIGSEAMLANTTGIANTAVGFNALVNNTIGTLNTAVGHSTMSNNTTGIQNTAVGQSAMNNNTIGTNNTAVGQAAMRDNTTGINNTAIGQNALFNNTIGIDNTAVGRAAMQNNTTGIANTAVGNQAMQSNTTGINNTAVGQSALVGNTIGTNNTAVGFGALFNNTTGINNTALGLNTLTSATTGSTNIAIGSGAGGILTTGAGNIYINANAGIATESSTTRIGTSQTSTFIAGIRGITTVNNNAIPVLIDSAGQLGTVSSTRRVKHDIKDMDSESANIYQLHPVTFVYNSDASETKQYGLIAEEADEVFSALVVHGADGQPETVQYHVLPVLLLNEIQKQQAAIEQQQITTENMNSAIAHLQAQIKQFIERINILEARG